MRPLVAIALVVSTGLALTAAPPDPLPKDDGYRGIWYYNQPSKDEYRYKYSGGFATYPQQHMPIAVYSHKANKTFFVYGGRPREKNELWHMVSYYDHATGKVPRPTVLLEKKTDDAHDNPTLALDDAGHLWVFSNSHGTARPSYIHKSTKPYSIDAFERVAQTNFSYGQPWHLPGKGFLFLHTLYSGGRVLNWTTSADGRTWEKPKVLSKFGQGHYQVSWRHGNRVGTAFDYHPKQGGLNARTNLYYLETADGGATWKTADGTTVTTPLTKVDNAALVRDYEKNGRLVYIKDLQFSEGRPVIVYVTSKGYEAGPKNDPRTWHTARWTGDKWVTRQITDADHNYDHGSLYVGIDCTWYLMATTGAGPEAYGTGGEVELWVSRDNGATWKRERELTRNSRRNHTYPRRPLDHHHDFAVLWADGLTRQPSESSLYFANDDGTRVRRLPEKMTGDFAKPEEVKP